MNKDEILHTRLGEMLEMIDCHAIAHGAKPKAASAPMSFDEALKLR
ncbi:MAG: hypothetical protein IJX37_00870 [Oscillospiraceae bacterium]|nr:hypothetical protein [Oscillospiraceae bacterium]